MMLKGINVAIQIIPVTVLPGNVVLGNLVCRIIANGAAVKAIPRNGKGPDNVATPLWWDKNP